MYKISRFFFLLLFITSCTSSMKFAPLKIEMPSNIPHIMELEPRIRQLYQAEIKRDWRTWYSITTMSKESSGKECSYAEFEKDVLKQQDGKYRIISLAINNVTLKETRTDRPIIAVGMDVVVKEVLSKPKKINDQTDYWVYIDDTWYWTWRGWPND